MVRICDRCGRVIDDRDECWISNVFLKVLLDIIGIHDYDLCRECRKEIVDRFKGKVEELQSEIRDFILKKT